jgi:ankyrin repeat protein
MLNKCHQAELGKLSPFLKNTQKSRHFTQSVVAGVKHLKGIIVSGKVPKKNPRDGIDEYGRTDVHYASDADEIEKLIQAGMDIDLQDDNGWCPMHFYAQNNNVKALEAALNYGANPNLYDSYGNSPLWTATMSAHGQFDCIIALLKAGAKAGHTNKHGRSPKDMANTINNGLEDVFSNYENA